MKFLPLFLVYFLGIQISQAEEGSILLNFQQADLHSIIEVISKETGKNFLLDPRIRKQKITLIAEQAVSPEDAYGVFLSILRIYGYGVVELDQLVKIIPINELKQNEIQLDKIGAKSDDFISTIITLKKNKAEKMASIIRPMMPNFSQAIAHGDSNSLIVLGPAGVVNKIKKVIKQLESRIQKSLDIVSLKYSSANELVAIMLKLEAKAIAKTNGLIMIANKSSNQIIISGGVIEDRTRAISYINQLDVAKRNTGDTQVIYLNYAKAKDLAAILKEIITKTKNGNKKISITADKNTNSLVVYAPNGLMQEIKSTIAQLDIRKAQVLVQAIIVEISDSDIASLGVRWGANTDKAVGLIDFSGVGSLAGVGGAIASGNALAGVAALGAGSSLALGNFSENGRGWGALLKALRGSANVNILSTPLVITLDNEEAELFVGQNVPVLKGQTLQNSGNPFTNYDRQDVGITLKVIPQINQGDAMQLKISQEVKNVQSSSSGVIGASSFNERRIKTSVIINDKEILVLGGLTQQQTESSVEKISGLGDIPLIGGLFKSRNSNTEKRTLMVFIKTDIIRDFKTSQSISAEKYSALYKQTKNRKSLSLIDKNNQIVLPSISETMMLKNKVNDTQKISTKSANKSAILEAEVHNIRAKETPSTPEN